MMMLTKKQFKWMIESKNLAGLYFLHPMEFLKLTTDSESQIDYITLGEDPKSHSRSKFESEAFSREWIEMPFIEIVDSVPEKPGAGFHGDMRVVGHEGRHRAWATLKSGDPWFMTAFFSMKKPLTAPPLFLQGQFRPWIKHRFQPECFIPIPF
jgi:hypothetical protein